MSEEKKKDASDSYDWLEAYVEAGFTRKEAMRILCRPHVTIAQQPMITPDTLEFYERQNALASKLLIEMDE